MRAVLNKRRTEQASVALESTCSRNSSRGEPDAANEPDPALFQFNRSSHVNEPDPDLFAGSIHNEPDPALYMNSSANQPDPDLFIGASSKNEPDPALRMGSGAAETSSHTSSAVSNWLDEQSTARSVGGQARLGAQNRVQEGTKSFSQSIETDESIAEEPQFSESNDGYSRDFE